MATTFVQQPAPGQPMFVPPGTAPVGPPVGAPGTVMYYPQAPGGAVILPAIASQPPKYQYTPNDFKTLSLITLIVCGFFSPLSVALSIPALLFSLQSKKNAQTGAIKVARKQGIISAYLNVAAIIAALLVACIAMGLVLGLYGPLYAEAVRGYRRNCPYYPGTSSYYYYC